MPTFRTPQTVVLSQMLQCNLPPSLTVGQTTYLVPAGVIYQGRVFCWNCIRKETLFYGTIDPFFTSTGWFIDPQCCKCNYIIPTTRKQLPKFTLPARTIVANTISQEVGEIICWETGDFESEYKYQVQCDGAVEIWHREDINTHPEGMRWK